VLHVLAMAEVLCRFDYLLIATLDLTDWFRIRKSLKKLAVSGLQEKWVGL